MPRQTKSSDRVSAPFARATKAAAAMADLRLKVSYQPLEAYKPNLRNARLHSAAQIQQIAKSMRQYGAVVPILVDENLNVIAGHGRLAAAPSAGLRELPSVCVSHLSPAQKQALAIADNKLATNSDWNEELLAEHLRELGDLNFDLETGFTSLEIDSLFASRESDGADPADQIAVATGPAISKPGMTWVVGRHRIRCDSCLAQEATRALFSNGENAAVVVTDPPFNVPINGHVSGKGAFKHREFAMASGEMSRPEFIKFLSTFLGEACAHLKQGGLVYSFMDWRHSFEILSAGEEQKLALMNVAAWCKPTPGMGSLYRSQHELCFIFKHGRGQHRNNVQLGRHGRSRSNVWQYPGANHPASTGEEGKLLGLHPTCKPVRLLADIMLDCTARGELAYDPFVGSGSSLIAAERVGRRCFSMEIDPGYVDTAVRRWQDFTGEKATEEGTGKRFDDFACPRKPKK